MKPFKRNQKPAFRFHQSTHNKRIHCVFLHQQHARRAKTERSDERQAKVTFATVLTAGKGYHSPLKHQEPPQLMLSAFCGWRRDLRRGVCFHRKSTVWKKEKKKESNSETRYTFTVMREPFTRKFPLEMNSTFIPRLLYDLWPS